MHKQTQREKEIRIYEVQQDDYVLGAEERERSIDIHKIIRGLQ